MTLDGRRDEDGLGEAVPLYALFSIWLEMKEDDRLGDECRAVIEMLMNND